MGRKRNHGTHAYNNAEARKEEIDAEIERLIAERDGIDDFLKKCVLYDNKMPACQSADKQAGGAGDRAGDSTTLSPAEEQPAECDFLERAHQARQQRLRNMRLAGVH